MKAYIRFCTLYLCFIPINAIAIKVPGLYEIEVPVIDQSEQHRITALQTAMRMVLIKLTGDRYAPERTSVLPLLQQAGNYVQQYRYEKPEIVNPETSGVDTKELRLWVRFDEEILNKVLRDLSVPIWGKERPSTLIWVVMQDESGRDLVRLADNSNYISIIDKRAQLRGIALIFPLLDLEDAAKLRPSDIWGGFKEPVLSASRRYNVDSILTGSVESPVSGIWEGHWRAYIDGQVTSWTTEGDLQDIVLDEGIDGMADILAKRFAHTGIFTEASNVKLIVADIFDVNQYAKVLKYLESLNSVTAVQVDEVIPGKVTFTLTAHGGQNAIAQAIELGNVLQAIQEDMVSLYRLIP